MHPQTALLFKHRARNRLKALRGRVQEGLLVAIEGGVGRRREDGQMECFAWVAVENAATGEVPPGWYCLTHRSLQGIWLDACTSTTVS